MSIPLGPSTPLVPPLYQSSVYTLPDLDALDQQGVAHGSSDVEGLQHEVEGRQPADPAPRLPSGHLIQVAAESLPE